MGYILSRQLTSWLDAYCELTEEFEPPTVFNKWVGLVILSVAAGRKICLPEANSAIYPNLYVVLSGPSGSGKTSAMREGLPFILQTGVPISPTKITAASLIQDIASYSVVNPDNLAYTSYLIWSEEFPAFLGTQAYETGLIADLTTLYDCAPFPIRKKTKTQGSDTIPNPYVCLLAGATPQGIFDVLPPGTICQGFTSRLMFPNSSYSGKPVPEKIWGDKQQRLFNLLISDLKQIMALKGPMQISAITKTLWKDYYNLGRKDLELIDSRIQGYASRKPFYVKKLMILLSLAESDKMIIEAQHLEKAIALLDELDPCMTEVYLQISPSVVINAYPKIVAALKRAPGNILDRSALMRRFSYTLDGEQFEKALKNLELQELIVAEPRVDKKTNRVKKYYRLTLRGMTYYDTVEHN